MAVLDQEITDKYAIYNGDSAEVLAKLTDSSVHLSIYSPPFASLYSYSSSERDLSNCGTYDEFLQHYHFIVKHIGRMTKPGRVSCVHCADLAISGQRDGYEDFPGDIIRLYRHEEFKYMGRVCIWKEPFRVAMRTRLQHLTHKNIARDSSVCFPAGADFILLFRKHGKNEEPISHPSGLSEYAGRDEVPADLRHHAGETRQAKNKLSQWIWRQYASAFWNDVRIDRVLPYREARESDDERHVCPLQLDVIERCLTLWSNPGDTVLTPFMGVGSEVFGAVSMGRRAIGIELKSTYYKQARSNIQLAGKTAVQDGLPFVQPKESDIDASETDEVVGEMA